MNISVNRENFNTLGEREIANFIEQAEELVVLAIPSMTNLIAESILKSKVENLHIIISQSDALDSRSFEHADAVKKLLHNNVLLRVSESFTLGAFVVDNRGWLFTPDVLPIQNINCFSVSKIEVQKLVSSLSAVIVQEHVEDSDKPELGESILTKEHLIKEIEEEKKELIVQSDIKKIQHLDIEFVETEFKGLRLATKKITIPKELTSLGMNDDVKEILSSSAKIFTGKHEFTNDLKLLEDRRNKLREDFLISIKDYGLLIRKHMKEDFNKELEAINNEKDKVKEKIFESLEKEIKKTKQSLINYYLPIAKKNPPNSLRKLNKIVDDKLLEEHLGYLFDKSLPDIQKLVDEIELFYKYKGLTLELLKDKKFLSLLEHKGVKI